MLSFMFHSRPHLAIFHRSPTQAMNNVLEAIEMEFLLNDFEIMKLKCLSTFF